MHTFTCNSKEELAQLASALIETYPENRIFAFYAPMGAGKTTFIKEICKYLKVTDNVASPTFAMVNEYATENNNSIYHFDMYRLKSWREMQDIGYEIYLDSGNYCFIEWAEKIENILPENCVSVKIEVVDESKRIISFYRTEP